MGTKPRIRIGHAYMRMWSQQITFIAKKFIKVDNPWTCTDWGLSQLAQNTEYYTNSYRPKNLITYIKLIPWVKSLKGILSLLGWSTLYGTGHYAPSVASNHQVDDWRSSS